MYDYVSKIYRDVIYMYIYVRKRPYKYQRVFIRFINLNHNSVEEKQWSIFNSIQGTINHWIERQLPLEKNYFHKKGNIFQILPCKVCWYIAIVCIQIRSYQFFFTIQFRNCQFFFNKRTSLSVYNFTNEIFSDLNFSLRIFILVLYL